MLNGKRKSSVLILNLNFDAKHSVAGEASADVIWSVLSWSLELLEYTGSNVVLQLQQILRQHLVIIQGMNINKIRELC